MLVCHLPGSTKQKMLVASRSVYVRSPSSSWLSTLMACLSRQPPASAAALSRCLMPRLKRGALFAHSADASLRHQQPHMDVANMAAHDTATAAAPGSRVWSAVRMNSSARAALAQQQSNL